jgi:hypothetical protein
MPILQVNLINSFGIEIICWNIVILFAIGYGTKNFIEIYKTDLLNRKQIHFSAGFWYIINAPFCILIQLGLFFPDYFYFFVNIAFLLIQLGMTIFVFYWEINLTNLKRIPTLTGIVVLCLFILNFIYFLFNGDNILDNFIIFLFVGWFLTSIYVVYFLVFKFMTKVVGNVRRRSIFQFSGAFFYSVALSIFVLVTLNVLNERIRIFVPIFILISGIVYYYGFNGVFEGLSSYYQQAHICTVHRGKIQEHGRIYYCPSCYIPYCQNCYVQVIKKEACWNCGYGKETDSNEWDYEEISINSIPKSKHKKKKD